jgi:adenosine deaminase
MFLRKTSDLHMHLNGSFSMAYLEMLAMRNHCVEEFTKLKQLREEYQVMLKQGINERSFAGYVNLIWAQFGAIHKIVQTLDDIREGTIDVVGSSKARYLEIRTTPKIMPGASPENNYVTAFVNGLVAANAKYEGKKVARGILSIDRTVHNLDDARDLIDVVVAEKNDSGMLIGIDLSGNPLAKRVLTGEQLGEAIQYALYNQIGVALHVGEVDTQIEKDDVDHMLKALIVWRDQQPPSDRNHFHGRVRLGHGIHFTEDQRTTIRNAQIPIEICPSCHEQLNWWNRNAPHPVTNIYSFWRDPVVSGTDDEIIFRGAAKKENRRLLKMLGFEKDHDKEEAREHQSQFRFSHNRVPR